VGNVVGDVEAADVGAAETRTTKGCPTKSISIRGIGLPSTIAVVGAQAETARNSGTRKLRIRMANTPSFTAFQSRQVVAARSITLVN
jgi:hypothetical protein